MITRKDVNAYNRNYVKNKISKGLCRSCSEPVVFGKTFCEKHLAIHTEQMKKLFNERRMSNLCIRCGKPTEPNKTLCTYHLEMAIKSQRKHQKNKDDQNKCKRCNNERAPGKNHCEYHLNVQREHAKNERIKNRSKGLCDCGKPVKEGYKRCILCIERRRKNKYSSWQRNGYNGNRQKALDRDNHSCQICNKQTDRPCVHHIDGNGSTSEIQNNDLDNLITLCGNCHRAIIVLSGKEVKIELAIKLLQKLL